MSTAEIPQLASELVELSKEYLRQETIEPAKALGRQAGLGLAASLFLSIGGLLLSVAVLRASAAALPDSELWSVAAYGIATVVALAAAGGLMWWATRRS